LYGSLGLLQVGWCVLGVVVSDEGLPCSCRGVGWRILGVVVAVSNEGCPVNVVDLVSAMELMEDDLG